MLICKGSTNILTLMLKLISTYSYLVVAFYALICHYFKALFCNIFFLALFCYCLITLISTITFSTIFYYYVEVLFYQLFSFTNFYYYFFFSINPNHEKIENVVLNNSIFIFFSTSTKAFTLWRWQWYDKQFGRKFQ
jgi:hypothetical protein